MNLSVEIKPDFEGTISITDYTREFDEYVNEDVQEVLPRYFNFKYSQTCTINVLKYVSSNGEELMNVFFSSHISEADSLRIPLPKDGYYIVEHFVLPTVDWLNNVKDQDLSIYNGIYITDGSNIYKYLSNELYVVNPIEVMEVNPENTTISIVKYKVFSIDRLKHCYTKIARNILNSYGGRCSSIDSVDRFNRDFLWMTLNVISYYLEWGKYSEAQLVLESLGCYNFCPDEGIFNVENTSCGCKK